MKNAIRLIALFVVGFSVTYAWGMKTQYESLRTQIENHNSIPGFVKQELLK